ncbi:Sensor histidine kinase YycG [Pseudooceanicola marinus]|uniref:histidine kinase n=1 Tax=Pseudooceanicola marinus TaxID=396013 RepID=A0A1X6ZZ93_9RHOB|nr:sensor histidine kinase [Pseudooceanicola marinus]PJE30144.1 histidine kinase [Pseudooceanicola marinus]SLN66079.1 Sensor histidine kinase YycG [Pseudooceanicola marinus]
MALAEGISVQDDTARARRGSGGAKKRRGDVVLGEEFEAPGTVVDEEFRARREKRGLLALKASPLTRKIIIFNLIALNVLVAGVLYLNSSRDSLLAQRQAALVSEADLVASVFEAQIAPGAEVDLRARRGVDVPGTLTALDLRSGLTLLVFDDAGELVAGRAGTASGAAPRSQSDQPTYVTDALTAIWNGITAVFSSGRVPQPTVAIEQEAQRLLADHGIGAAETSTAHGSEGRFHTALSPIEAGGQVVGAVALAGSVGEIDDLVRQERERVLQMFIIATLVSVGLSLVLASTIANPLSDLAAAAELGGDRGNTRPKPSRVRIPDLTARPDEIGRLSGALRGMVSALYDRIDANEQFAADVAHEIKNPLASLRSAVGTLRVAKRDDQREQLMDVIEHDVRRLDRLVSDISNASRLDSELVKEEEEEFDLLRMLGSLTDYLGEQAAGKGIDFITDLPDETLILSGLEARLAQVFVNLITNAISFCEEGDAIRVWARRRENRVLVVVEDTGPGIPDQSLQKIFKRFYSHRPASDFGNNSGLGLAISKQIVEAHGGVIWAENIRPTDADITSDPLGARFVVGLPI